VGLQVMVVLDAGSESLMHNMEGDISANPLRWARNAIAFWHSGAVRPWLGGCQPVAATMADYPKVMSTPVCSPCLLAARPGQ
jgi:hypothetical protein